MSHAITKHVGDSHIHCIQQTEAVVVTHCVRTSFTVQCMSHARYYNACWGLTHTLYSTNGVQLLLHTVTEWYLPFNTHAHYYSDSHIHCIQQTECSYCYCVRMIFAVEYTRHMLTITTRVGDSALHAKMNSDTVVGL